MATITSAQSGNFSATATWVGGVVPADGDSFIIASGHTVTYDSAMPVRTTGFQNSTINGILQHQTSATTTLRMNGVLTVATNGCYHMRSNATLEFRGTAAELHGLWINGQAGASFVAEGVDGMPSTTLTAGANEGSTSFTVASATNFAVGEWIAVFDNITAQANDAGATTLRDEGFWIHDISGNTIFFRQFVGPETNIISASGSTITVNNSKVFRIGQKIIFGTGANRNVRTISNINYSTHVITLDSAVTGTVVGLTVYETGTDKIHGSGEKVRKVATVTTVASTSTATTITVANANQFTAGDVIWIEARSECGGTLDGNFNTYDTARTVTSVAGNVITLNAAIGYNVVKGALVTRLSRNINVKAIDTSNFCYFHFDSFTTNFGRKLIVKDVFFDRVGSSASGNARGVSFRGFASTNSLPVTISQTAPALSREPWLEGITMRHSGSILDLSSLFIWDCRYAKLRCSFVMNARDGLSGPWNTPGQALYNCISTRNDRWGMRSEGFNEWGEVAYIYFSRNYHGYRVAFQLEDGLGYHHIISDANNEYSSMMYGCTRNLNFYKHKQTGTRYGIYHENSPAAYLYSSTSFLSGLTNTNSNPPGTPYVGYYYAHMDRGDNGFQVVNIVEDNFEYDRIRQFATGTERTWDFSENAWRVYNRYDYADYGYGWSESIYIPSGVTLRASCAIKLAPSYSGNYPRFEARSNQSNIGPNQFGNAGGQWSSVLSGGFTSTQYTVAASNDYQNAELTITSKPFPRYIQVGVHVDSANTSEGYWMKDILLFLDRDYASPVLGIINRGSMGALDRYIVENGFSQNQIRISGGRLK